MWLCWFVLFVCLFDQDVEIAGEDHEIKCLISYENTKFEWYYEKHEDDGDDKNHKINYDKFILFLSNKTKRDENSMKIYHLDKEGDDTDDGDIIDDCGDFELYFEDTTHKTRHFKVKAASGGYKVKIDLGEADCKESIIMTIPQHGFDNSKEEEWFNSWQDTSNEIGAKLNDSNWESKYSLNHSKQRDSIVNVSQFSSVFKNFANDDKSVDFCLKVECFILVCCCGDVKPLFFLGVSLCFFLVFLFLRDRYQQVRVVQVEQKHF